jgi:hypothetical protein
MKLTKLLRTRAAVPNLCWVTLLVEKILCLTLISKNWDLAHYQINFSQYNYIILTLANQLQGTAAPEDINL